MVEPTREGLGELKSEDTGKDLEEKEDLWRRFSGIAPHDSTKLLHKRIRTQVGMRGISQS